MLRDSIKPLREAVAWILVGVVAAEFLLGMWDLLRKPASEYEDNWFLYNAYYGTSSFVGFTTAAMLVVALLVATVLPDKLPRARPVVLIVAIESGVMLLLGIVTSFLGLFYVGRTYSGVTSGPDGVDKAQTFIGNLPSLALTLVPLLLALAMLRTTDLSGGPRVPPQPGGYYGQQQFPPQQFPPQQQPYPAQHQQFPPQQQQPGYPTQQPQPGSFPEWGGPQQGGGYGQGW